MVDLTGQLSNPPHLMERLYQRALQALAKPERPAQQRRAARQRPRRLSSHDMELVVKEYESGLDMPEIARMHSVHRTTISHCLREQGVAIRRQGLQPEQIAKAAKLYDEGWSLARIGVRYGVAHTVVRKALLDSGVSLRQRNGWS